MNNPNYDSSNQNVARGNAAGDNSVAGSNADADATRSLQWDSAWQPDRDEDYGTPVQQYTGPGAFPPMPPLPMPQQSQQHPYAQAAQNVPGYPPAPNYVNPPVQGYPGTPVQSYPNPPMQGYSTPSTPDYNVKPAPYAPVTIYQGDQQMTPMQQNTPLSDQQTYRGYAPADQQYNGQPLPSKSPSTRPVMPWFIWLIVGIVVLSIFSSGGWWGFWPIYSFWPFFIFWPLFIFGRLGRYGRYGRRWRNRNRW